MDSPRALSSFLLTPSAHPILKSCAQSYLSARQHPSVAQYLATLAGGIYNDGIVLVPQNGGYSSDSLYATGGRY